MPYTYPDAYGCVYILLFTNNPNVPTYIHDKYCVSVNRNQQHTRKYIYVDTFRRNAATHLRMSERLTDDWLHHQDALPLYKCTYYYYISHVWRPWWLSNNTARHKQQTRRRSLMISTYGRLYSLRRRFVYSVFSLFPRVPTRVGRYKYKTITYILWTLRKKKTPVRIIVLLAYAINFQGKLRFNGLLYGLIAAIYS